MSFLLLNILFDVTNFQILILLLSHLTTSLHKTSLIHLYLPIFHIWRCQSVSGWSWKCCQITKTLFAVRMLRTQISINFWGHFILLLGFSQDNALFLAFEWCITRRNPINLSFIVGRNARLIKFWFHGCLVLLSNLVYRYNLRLRWIWDLLQNLILISKINGHWARWYGFTYLLVLRKPLLEPRIEQLGLSIAAGWARVKYWVDYWRILLGLFAEILVIFSQIQTLCRVLSGHYWSSLLISTTFENWNDYTRYLYILVKYFFFEH